MRWCLLSRQQVVNSSSVPSAFLETVRKTATELDISEDMIVILDREIEGFRSVKALTELGRRKGKEGQVSIQIPGRRAE